MPAYRIYIITRDGHITAPAHGIESEDEQEAISKAAQAANGKAAGLWEGARVSSCGCRRTKFSDGR